MDGVIKAHCMGMEFPKATPEDRARFLEGWERSMGQPLPKRDTDSPKVEWVLPTAAALDAVAEEQRVKEETDGK